MRSGRAFRETDLMITPAENRFYQRMHELNELAMVQPEVGLIRKNNPIKKKSKRERKKMLKSRI